MIIKYKPEDFYVREIFDIKKFEKKDEGRDFFYFILKKRNYNQIRALKKISRIFNVSVKRIHFAGTKDKIGVTEQVISINSIKENEIENKLNIINNKVKDLNLKYIGKYKGRINLGDLEGNYFEIVIRDLKNSDIKLCKKNIKDIKKDGLVNYFDKQRFGYANNSHIIGKLIIKGKIKEALIEIFTSLPENPSEDLKEFVLNFPEGLEDKNSLKFIIKNLPKNMREYQKVIEHLLKYTNDYSGAFRKLHKKLRTLYVNAYQSYLWNLTAKKLKEENVNLKEIELLGYNTNLENLLYKDIILDLLKKENLNLDDFKISHMPELSLKGSKRNFKIYPKELEILEIGKENLDNSESYFIKVKFILDSGAYATNVITSFFTKK